MLNSLPDDKSLDKSKLKAFADDKRNASQKLKFVLRRAGNIVGEKREKFCLPVFSPFPTMFSKALYLRVVKSQNCVVKS